MDGTIFSWGVGTCGQLGNGGYRERQAVPRPASTPWQVAGVVSIACADHNLLVSTDGAVLLWGAGDNGQLGTGEHEDPEICEPSRLALGEGVISADCGLKHSVVATTAGRVLCFGQGAKGQLGLGDNQNVWRPVAVERLRGTIIQLVVCGWNHSCALSNDGSMFCWGDGTFGQLGSGARASSDVPVKAALDEGVLAVSIAAGGNQSSAIGADGQLYMWGMNSTGQLGIGSVTTCTHPVATRLQPCGAVACGYRHTLAITLAGELYAWGNGGSGQLGVEGVRDLQAVTVPRLVSGFTDSQPVFVACGKDISACATADGSVYTWGDGTSGALGLGSSRLSKVFEPSVVEGLAGRSVQAVACGVSHMVVTCGVPVGGEGRPGAFPDSQTLRSWGDRAHAAGARNNPWQTPRDNQSDLTVTQLVRPHSPASQQRSASRSPPAPSTWQAGETQEVDNLKLQLNEHFLAAAQERRHNEMLTQHLHVEHKLKLQTELERSVELERQQLKTDHEQAVASLTGQFEQQLQKESGEKERAWAAYNMMRKLVEQEKQAKNAHEQLLMSERILLEDGKNEKEEMRREVTRLQQKMMQAFEDKSESQVSMIEQAALNTQLTMHISQQAVLVEKAQRNCLSRLYTHNELATLKHSFSGWALCCRHPRELRIQLETSLHKERAEREQLLEAAEADKKCLAMEATYQSFLAKQMAATINHLEEARRTLLVHARDGSFQARLSGAQQLSARFDRWRDGLCFHVMAKWKIARALSMAHKSSMAAISDSEARRSELLAMHDSGQQQLQDAREQLQRQSESSRRRGALLLLQCGSRLRLVDAANCLLVWRCAIADENESWWHASRSEEIRLRTLLRGHGSISGGTTVRLLHRAWTNQSLGRVFWSWKCNYLVDDAFVSSAVSHTEIFDGARRHQSVHSLQAVLRRLSLQRVRQYLCAMKESFQRHQGGRQESVKSQLHSETSNKTVGLRMLRRSLRMMRQAELRLYLVAFVSNRTAANAAELAAFQKGGQMMLALREASRTSSLRLLSAIQRRWARFPLAAVVSSWRLKLQAAVIGMQMQMKSTEHVMHQVRLGDLSRAATLTRELRNRLVLAAVGQVVTVWARTVAAVREARNGNMTAQAANQRLAEAQLTAADAALLNRLAATRLRALVSLTGVAALIATKAKLSAAREWVHNVQCGKLNQTLVLHHMHDLRQQILRARRRESCWRLRRARSGVLQRCVAAAVGGWGSSCRSERSTQKHHALQIEREKLGTQSSQSKQQTQMRTNSLAMTKLRFLLRHWKTHYVHAVLMRFRQNAHDDGRSVDSRKTLGIQRLGRMLLNRSVQRLGAAYHEWCVCTALTMQERELQSVIKLMSDATKRKAMGARAERNMAVHGMWCDMWRQSSLTGWRMWAAGQNFKERAGLKDAMVKHQIWGARRDAGARAIRTVVLKFNGYQMSSCITAWRLATRTTGLQVLAHGSLRAADAARKTACDDLSKQGGVRLVHSAVLARLRQSVSVCWSTFKANWSSTKLRLWFGEMGVTKDRSTALVQLVRMTQRWRSVSAGRAVWTLLCNMRIEQKVAASHRAGASRLLQRAMAGWRQSAVRQHFSTLQASWLRDSATDQVSRQHAQQHSQELQRGGVQTLAAVMKRLRNASASRALISMRRNWLVAATRCRMVNEGSSRVETAVKALQQAAVLREMGMLITQWDAECKRRAVRALQCVCTISSVHTDQKHRAMRKMALVLRRQQTTRSGQAVHCWAQRVGSAQVQKSALSKGRNQAKGLESLNQILKRWMWTKCTLAVAMLREGWRVGKKSVEVKDTKKFVEQLLQDFEVDSQHWSSLQGELQTLKIKTVFQHTLYQWRVMLTGVAARAFYSWTQTVASKSWSDDARAGESLELVADLEVRMMRSDKDKQMMMKTIDRLSRDLGSLIEKQ